MKAKVEITGTIEVLTGMHIGGLDAYSAIGAVDSPVIKDPLLDLPMIPGSSLKGKLRYLAFRSLNKEAFSNSHENDGERVLRLFGSSSKDDEGRIHKSRIIFRDMVLANMEELSDFGIPVATEIKMENSINRLTAVANPRQIERVIRGSKFDLSIIYNVEDDTESEEDLKLLLDCFKLLELDYLGGHGSRGYGRVKISDLDMVVAIGEMDDGYFERLLKEFEG